MYTLKDFLTSIVGLSVAEVASDELFCSESDIGLTMLTNEMQQTLAGYSYTLVREGWLEVVYNGQKLMLQRNDLLIYSPGFQITIARGSEDYHSICLIMDEMAALEIPSVRNVIRTAYEPIAVLGQPVIHLDEAQASHFCQHLLEVIRYEHSSHMYLKEALRTLYTQFLLDLLDVMEQKMGQNQVSERSTELFVAFMRLLPVHFIEHHDIGFYAFKLCITTIHLSRIVRKMTGRTVGSYIDQMLVMEASWLLRSTDLSIAAVAERLHFADQSSFGRFFTRMKGVNPKRFRVQGLALGS